MSEHPNAISGLRVLEAFSSGDVKTLQEIWSRDVIAHIATFPYRGTYRGIDQVLEMLANYQKLAGYSLRVEPETALADDNYVMLFFRAEGERDGRRLNSQYVAAAKVGADRKWREFWLMPDDVTAVEHFWGA